MWGRDEGASSASASSSHVDHVLDESRNPPAEGRVQQEHVQPHDDRSAGGGEHGRDAAVDEHAHDVAATGEEHQGDDRQRQDETEDHLADDQRARSGRARSQMTMMAGNMVTSRRTQIGIVKPTNPCMITWPAMVPTDELERPEARSETAKTMPAALPSRGVSVW